MHHRTAPVLAKGLRPFFLLASLWGVSALPAWLLDRLGRVQVGSPLGPIGWHAHEMVFGYAVAVIAGFLLTAASNWTGRTTAVGLPLAGLAGLWLAGRVALVAPAPPLAAAIVDLSFLPALALALGRALFAARNRRNYGFLGILGALWAANLTVHLDTLGLLPGWRRQGPLVGVDVLVLIIVVVAGRVVPAFTRNATRAAGIRNVALLDRGAVAAMIATIALDAGQASRAAGLVAGIAGLLAVARAATWGARHALRDPMLWVLHLGYAWIPFGLVLRGLSVACPSVPPVLANHAITVGAVGTLTIGMMARVSLGHTGRAIEATRPVALSFVLITLAAAVRVGGLAFATTRYLTTVVVAGVLWTAAFAIFLTVFAPLLVRPRADGRPG